MRLRVLVVTPFGTSSVVGGAEKWLFGMIMSLPNISWDVLCLQEGPFQNELRLADVPASVHPTGPSAQSIVGAARHVSRVIGRTRPDVVVGNGVKAQLIVALATPLRGVPTVWVKHDYSYDRSLAPALGWISDSVVSTAADVAAMAHRDDCIVIHPPLQDGTIHERDAARRRLREDGIEFDDRPTLVMAGRLVPYKGVEDAIAGLAGPGAERWRLVVVGDDDQSSPGERARLSRLASEICVADRVSFFPAVPGLGDLFSAFDALAVLTKPTDRRAPAREGFGMTAFEAMQSGIPVIAVEGSPAADRLAGQAGVTIPPARPQDVAAALDRLSDPVIRAKMGSRGQRLVADFASVAEVADTFATVLGNAAGNSRVRGLMQRASRTLPTLISRWGSR